MILGAKSRFFAIGLAVSFGLLFSVLIACNTPTTPTPSPNLPAAAPAVEATAAPKPIPTETTVPATPTAPVPLFTPLPRPARSPYDLSELIDDDPAKVDNSSLPVTPLDLIHTTGQPQPVDIAAYRLKIDGQVERPLSLSYEELLAMPTHTEVALLICPGVFVDNTEWTGVPLKTVLDMAQPKPGATLVNLYALDDYREPITLEFAGNDGVFLAHTVDGVPLPPEHGFPLRLVQRGVLGGRWLKWVSRIEVY
jgi:DMSO/TMAO reductase YedYZ molybdopterin-dependent catalytic subunit